MPQSPRSRTILAALATCSLLGCSDPPPAVPAPPPPMPGTPSPYYSTPQVAPTLRTAVAPPEGERFERCEIPGAPLGPLEVPVAPGETLRMEDPACLVTSEGVVVAIEWPAIDDERFEGVEDWRTYGFYQLQEPRARAGTGTVEVLGAPLQYAVARGWAADREVEHLTGSRPAGEGHVLLVSIFVPSSDPPALSRALDMISRARRAAPR